MKLIRRKDNYNPFYELDRLHNELNSLFDWTFGGGGYPERQLGLLETGWAPAVDVYDSKDNILVKADVPGLKKEDIDVTIQDNTLIIRGEKKEEHEERDKDYVRTERFHGAFHRTITLPGDVDAAKAKAEYKNGTLELTLPKKEEAKPKQISVDVK
ncbi:MAG: Hsp20/alpha crystallin family protein [Candidatus Omnitrophica bacterium]|nr:Hsp20/alpha crystallin family protein [Candidatus Omnitrophota bacterium]